MRVISKPLVGSLTWVTPIVRAKQIYDVDQFLPHRRLAARKPEVREWPHGGGDFLDFVKRQGTFLIEAVPVEAGAADRIAARRHKEDQHVENFMVKKRPGKIRNNFKCFHDDTFFNLTLTPKNTGPIEGTKNDSF